MSFDAGLVRRVQRPRKVGQETDEEKANRLWAQEAETNAQKLCNHLEANAFQEFGLGTVEPGGPLEEYKELLSTGLQTQDMPHPLVWDQSLLLKQSGLNTSPRSWQNVYKECAEATKCGVLILAGEPQYFLKWVSSAACQDEVKLVDDPSRFEAVARMEQVDSQKVENSLSQFVEEILAESDGAFMKMIVLECTELPHYAARLRRVSGLPVLDLVTCANFFAKVLVGSF
ncbi:ALMA1 [Symbiodinium necroappetens]|uniref:ALMA1 protein n=1 Tax=Symbiodinium necroappetens TaxID=1628268 RepID=A0A812Y3L0_9DINO|nr:ALMA1 [Symbiodinium necroappetens]